MLTDFRQEFRNIPMLRLTLPLIAGIVCAGVWSVAMPLLIVVGVGCASMLWAFRRTRGKDGALVALLFVTGFTLSQLNRLEYSVPRNELLQMQLRIREIPISHEGSRWHKSVADIAAYRQMTPHDTSWHSDGERVVLYLDTNYRVDVGDRLLVRAQMNSIVDRSGSGEGYRRYLKIRRITGAVYLPQGSLDTLLSQADYTWLCDAKRIQRHLSNQFRQTRLSDRDRGVLTAILTGERADLDPETRRDYARTGVSHILALSGLHLSMLFFILNIILKPIFFSRRRGYIIKTILIIAVIWAYSVITGMSLSICRAAIMLSVIQLSLYFSTRTNVYNSLFLAAFLTLVAAPEALYDLGFQLSYLAVLSILFFYPRIHRLFRPPLRVMRWIWNIAAVAFAAQIGVIPLIIYNFNYLPVLSMFVNPMIMITTPIIMISGVVFLIFNGIEFTDLITNDLMNLLFTVQNRAVETASDLSYAVIDDLRLSTWGVWSCYGAILAVAAGIKEYETRRQIKRNQPLLVPRKCEEKYTDDLG